MLVQRQLPSKISILISERKPVAWIAPDAGAKTREEVLASPKSFLVDTHGVLLRARRVLPPYLGLPIIRNANADRLAPGQVADSEEVHAALDLLRAHGDSLVGARFQVDEIDLSRGYGLMVRDRGGLQVLFGLDDPDLHLKTLENVLSAVNNSGRRAATISLMTLESRQRNIPVTFQPDLPPPAPPSPEPEAAAAPPSANGSSPPAPPVLKDKPTKDPAADKKDAQRHDETRERSRSKPTRARVAARPPETSAQEERAVAPRQTRRTNRAQGAARHRAVPVSRGETGPAGKWR